MEIVGFRGPKSKYRHCGIVLTEHGHVRTEEREAEKKQKNLVGESRKELTSTKVHGNKPK